MGRGTKAHRPPSHISKTVLSTVHVGGDRGPRFSHRVSGCWTKRWTTPNGVDGEISLRALRPGFRVGLARQPWAASTFADRLHLPQASPASWPCSTRYGWPASTCRRPQSTRCLSTTANTRIPKGRVASHGRLRHDGAAAATRRDGAARDGEPDARAAHTARSPRVRLRYTPTRRRGTQGKRAGVVHHCTICCPDHYQYLVHTTRSPRVAALLQRRVSRGAEL